MLSQWFQIVSVVTLTSVSALSWAQGVPSHGSDQIWNLDAQLQQSLNDAVSSYPTISAARASLTAADADLSAAKWARFPTISVQESALQNTNNLKTYNQKNLQTVAMIDQPVWTGGVISGNIDRMTFEQQSALAGVGEAILDIELQVLQSYFDVQRQQQWQVVLKRSITEHQKLVEMMTRRVQQEVSPVSDLDLSISRMAQLQQQFSTITASRNVSVQRIRDLVGNSTLELPLHNLGEDSTPEFVLSDLIDKTLEYSPTLLRRRADSQAAAATITVTRAELMPKVSVNYAYDDTLGGRVGLTIKSQFSGGLSGFAVSQSAKQKQQAIELQLEAIERQTRNLVIADYEEYQSGKNKIKVTNEASEAAQRISASYMRQFTSGQRNWIELMNAVREATSAELDAIDAHIGTQIALTKLILRSGLWRPE